MPELFDQHATFEQVARHYRVSVSTVRAWTRRGLIPFIHIGGIYRFDIADIDKVLKERSTKPPPVHSITEMVAVPGNPQLALDLDA